MLSVLHERSDCLSAHWSTLMRLGPTIARSWSWEAWSIRMCRCESSRPAYSRCSCVGLACSIRRHGDAVLWGKKVRGPKKEKPCSALRGKLRKVGFDGPAIVAGVALRSRFQARSGPGFAGSKVRRACEQCPQDRDVSLTPVISSELQLTEVRTATSSVKVRC